MAKNGGLTDRMLERMKLGSKMPGWPGAPQAFDSLSTIEDPEA